MRIQAVADEETDAFPEGKRPSKRRELARKVGRDRVPMGCNCKLQREKESIDSFGRAKVAAKQRKENQ